MTLARTGSWLTCLVHKCLLQSLQCMRHLILDDFLDESECKGLIELAAPHLQAATSWDVEKGRDQISEYRIADQMFFQRGQNDLIKTVEEKCAKLSGYPVENGEAIQYIQYSENGHYKSHYDFFDPNFKGNQ